MIKYTILYKNGKTWNGKATHLRNILCVDCHIMVATYPYMTNSVRTDVLVPAELLPSCLGWVLKHFSIKEIEPKKTKRTPNPKSKTKKQKALEDEYHRWVRDWHQRGSSDITMQACKKWLYEQKQEDNYLTEVVGALPEYKVALYTNADKQNNGDWLPWNGGKCPVPDDTKVEVKFRSGSLHLFDYPQDFWWGRDVYEWHCDIVAYKLYEPELEKVTFPSGASVSFHDSKDVLKGCKECYVSHEPWDGVYKPWKESAIERLHKQVDEHWKFMDKVVGILDNKPIKTTYTFWLGAFGEVADV